MGTDGANPRKGGGGPKGVTDVLHRRDTAGPPLRGGVLGSDGEMEAALDAFQGRVARRLTGRTPRRGRDGKWKSLPLARAIKDAGIVRVRTSVLRRQNTVAQFVATRPILALCEGSERRGGTRVPQRWWEQTGIDWRLARERSENAETEGDGTTTATTGTETTTPAMEASSDSDTGSGGRNEEEESLGASGSIGAEWSGAEAEE